MTEASRLAKKFAVSWPHLDERARRLMAASEARAFGHGGVSAVVSRDELLSRVWGVDPGAVETRTVDVHVARLREKLRDPPGSAGVIRTVRGKGYSLNAERSST